MYNRGIQQTTPTKGKTMSLANDPQFQAEVKAEQQFLDRIENRNTLAHYDRDQLLELCLDLLESEKEKREELDKLQGIIR
jgi:hypothetical protein